MPGSKAQPAQDPDLGPDGEEEADDTVIGRAFRRSLLAIVLLAAIVGGAVYWMNRQAVDGTVQFDAVVLPHKRQAARVEIPRAPFTDVTEAAGITFLHENGAYGEKLLPETMGSGCAFFDYDNDGHQDLLLVNSCHWPWRPDAKNRSTMALYRNDGKGHFADVTDEVGLSLTFYGTGVAVGDYDNDGKVDLFVSALGGNHLFHNEGTRFVEVTETAGVAGSGKDWSTSCAFFDFDNDGDLDLFVCNYVRWSKKIDLDQDFRLVGVGRAYGPPAAFEGSFAYLYRNDGNGKFTDVSAQAGVQVTNPATGVPMGKSLGVAPIDLDGDGWMDLVVANDTVQNFVFHNQKDGTFREIGAEAGMAFDPAGNARGAMGIDTACFRNNQDLAVAIGNFANEMTSLFVSQSAPMQFADEAIATGLGPPTRLVLTFGVFFFDYDLDGRLDLFHANGHLEQEINKVQASQHYEQPAQLFWNCGPDQTAEFLPVPAEKCGPDLGRVTVGRGAAYADIDGDGDLDVVLTATGRPPRLLRNDQQLGHHWLRIKLVGKSANRDAIGATIEVAQGAQVLRRPVMPTRGYMSQSELPVTIGLGSSTKVDRLTIRWPGGATQEITDVLIDRPMTVEQSP